MPLTTQDQEVFSYGKMSAPINCAQAPCEADLTGHLNPLIHPTMAFLIHERVKERHARQSAAFSINESNCQLNVGGRWWDGCRFGSSNQGLPEV